MVEQLNAILSMLLAVSVGVERVLTILKTLFPLLAIEREAPTRDVDPVADRHRRVALHLLAIAASWLTCTLLFDERDPLAWVHVGDGKLPLWTLVLLGSGGSALWNDVLGYTKALKDNTRVLKVANALKCHEPPERARPLAPHSGTAMRSHEGTAGGQ